MRKGYPRTRIAARLLMLALIVSIAGAGCGAPAPPAAQPAPPAAQPALPEEGLKEINGTRLYYQTIGAGKPIIFLHGGPGGSHRYFLPHVQPLAGEYQLLLYDQRGSGLSDGRLDLKAISIDQFVEDLEALRVAFGLEKVSLLGHSWGAVIALFYAFKYQAHLDKLILVDPRPVSNTFLIEQGTTLRERGKRLSPQQQQALATVCQRPNGKLTADERAECLQIDATLRFYDPAKARTMDTTTDENTAKNASTIQSLITASFDRRQADIDAGLRSVRVPTLILHGDFDPIPLGACEYIQQRIAGSRLTVVKQSGHFPFVEQPDAFRDAVRAFMRS